MSNYFTYWHITAPVFIRPADTSDLYKSAKTKHLSAELLQFAETHQKFAVLTGATGSGKTTLLRWLAATVPMKTHDVFLTTLLSREQTAGWLLPRIAGYFQSVDHEKKEWAPVICAGFEQLRKEDRHLIVCVDAAHLISTDDALADLEAFFNLQDLADSPDPRFAIILSGGNELVERIRKYSPLSVRVNSLLETGGIERHELDEYLALRLKQAGIAVTFDPDALTMIFRHSQGNFMTTNMALERCLIEAANKNSRRITAFIAEHSLNALNALSSPKSTLQKSETDGKSTLSGLIGLKDKQGDQQGDKKGIPLSTGAAEQNEKKMRADQSGLSKNDHEKTSTIKLSSLFKQDEE